MDPTHEPEPAAYDDLDDPTYRPPRWVTDDQAVIRAIRSVLEDNQVPPEQRQVFAHAFYEDWVFTEAEAWERWLDRCRERSYATDE